MSAKPVVHKISGNGTVCGWGSLAENPKLTKVWKRVTCSLCLRKADKLEEKKEKPKKSKKSSK